MASAWIWPPESSSGRSKGERRVKVRCILQQPAWRVTMGLSRSLDRWPQSPDGLLSLVVSYTLPTVNSLFVKLSLDYPTGEHHVVE